jgi:hypothetical protein
VPNAKLFSVMQALSFSQSGGQILPEGKKIFVLGEAQWDCRRFICRRAGAESRWRGAMVCDKPILPYQTGCCAEKEAEE